jgi:hypothetical protein
MKRTGTEKQRQAIKIETQKKMKRGKREKEEPKMFPLSLI